MTTLDDLLGWLTAAGLSLGTLTSLVMGLLFSRGLLTNDTARHVASLVIPFVLPYVLWLGGGLLQAWPINQVAAAHVLIIALAAISANKATYTVGKVLTAPPPPVPPPPPLPGEPVAPADPGVYPYPVR